MTNADFRSWVAERFPPRPHPGPGPKPAFNAPAAARALGLSTGALYLKTCGSVRITPRDELIVALRDAVRTAGAKCAEVETLAEFQSFPGG